jgi:hypothetical protein
LKGERSAGVYAGEAVGVPVPELEVCEVALDDTDGEGEAALLSRALIVDMIADSGPTYAKKS